MNQRSAVASTCAAPGRPHGFQKKLVPLVDAEDRREQAAFLRAAKKNAKACLMEDG